MKDMFVCPNCGKLIAIQSLTTPVACNHCGEKLLVSPGNRVVLANPIRSYTLSDELQDQGEQQQLRFSTAARPPVSPERKKRTARLAHERMVHQEQLYHSGLVYGILTIVFGGFLGILSWLRSEYIRGDWAGLIGQWIGAFVFALGTFVTIWLYRSLRSTQASMRALEKEML